MNKIFDTVWNKLVEAGDLDLADNMKEHIRILCDRVAREYIATMSSHEGPNKHNEK